MGEMLLALMIYVTKELPDCNKKRDGRVYYHTVEQVRYLCDSDLQTWINLDARKGKEKK